MPVGGRGLDRLTYVVVVGTGSTSRQYSAADRVTGDLHDLFCLNIVLLKIFIIDRPIYPNAVDCLKFKIVGMHSWSTGPPTVRTSAKRWRVKPLFMFMSRKEGLPATPLNKRSFTRVLRMRVKLSFFYHQHPHIWRTLLQETSEKECGCKTAPYKDQVIIHLVSCRSCSYYHLGKYDNEFSIKAIGVAFLELNFGSKYRAEQKSAAPPRPLFNYCCNFIYASL